MEWGERRGKQCGKAGGDVLEGRGGGDRVNQPREKVGKGEKDEKDEKDGEKEEKDEENADDEGRNGCAVGKKGHEEWVQRRAAVGYEDVVSGRA